MKISLVPRSTTATAYDSTQITEKYYCNFGVNPDFVEQIAASGFVVAGKDRNGECRVMEIPSHPFFVGTLYVPQAKSQSHSPHPLINAFLSASQRHHASP
jgi:CTP synthase (UTP-ammonia lyase)